MHWLLTPNPLASEVRTMNIPIPAETPDPNIDNPILPPQDPRQDPGDNPDGVPVQPTVPPTVGDPPTQEPPAIL
jgi:hypothetical protein